MIRHHPAGRGHAYLPSLDQRDPVIAEEGHLVAVGALAGPEIAGLVIEVVRDGVSHLATCDRLDDVASGDGSTDAGHLSAAAEAGEDTGGMLPWRVHIGPFSAGQSVRYRFRSADDRYATAWFDLPVGCWQRAGGEFRLLSDRSGGANLAFPEAGISVEWFVANGRTHRVRFGLPLAVGEHVVGFGERFHSLDQRGWAIDATVFEQYRSQGVRTYLPVPFAHVVGGVGWGFHVDTTRRVWFDVGHGSPDLLRVEAQVDADDPRLDLRLWQGDPAAVLSGFLQVVGEPKTVPAWALRPWISSNEWNTQQRVEAEVARSLDAGIAVGVVVIEAWSDEGTIYLWRDARYEPRPDGGPFRLADFTFPADGAWPDPAGMVERLHERGVRVVLWQIPLIPDHDLDVPQLRADRSALLERGFAVSEADGRPYRNRGWWFPGALLPDFSDEQVRSWWTDKRRYLVAEMGIDGFKTDGGEHAWGEELRYADGTRGAESNNRFPNLYARAFHELFDRVGVAGVTFSRSGHAGAGTFPAHWAGDEESTWEGYRASITAGLTAGASGIFLWSWDHGGFSGPLPSAELYLRTAAMACFSPLMQYHSEFNGHRVPSRDRTPWNVAEQTGEPAVLDIYRKLTELRERLVPYLADQAQRSVDGAKPLMRALFFDYPGDEAVWDFPSQYLLGDELLVAPVTDEGADTWQVYLPPGDWVDVWTGAAVTGATVVSRLTPIDVIPVYCRRNAWSALAGVFRPYAAMLPA